MTDMGICKLCSTEKAIYTCPKCNIPYCSLLCYKNDKHLSCSEDFYKDCILEELQSEETSVEAKRQVMEMLRKVQQDDLATQDEEEEDLEERLKGLDLDKDSDEVWDRLTNEEQQEFLRLAEAGEIQVEADEPWWRTPLVEEVGFEHEAKSLKPDIRAEIPDLKGLLKNKVPAVSIAYDLLNVIFGYAYVTRFRNCDLHSDVNNTCIDMLLLSPALMKSQCNSPGDGLHLTLSLARDKHNNLIMPDDSLLSIFDDTAFIIKGPTKAWTAEYLLRSLSDLWIIFQAAHDTMKRNREKNLRKKAKEAYIAIKRLEFFQSYTKDMYTEQVKGLVRFIAAEKAQFQIEIKSHSAVEEKIKSDWEMLGHRYGQATAICASKSIIEELD